MLKRKLRKMQKKKKKINNNNKKGVVDCLFVKL